MGGGGGGCQLVGFPVRVLCLGDFFFNLGVSGHSFFRAILKASDTQRKENNINEHTSKGGVGKASNTHTKQV